MQNLAGTKAYIILLFSIFGTQLLSAKAEYLKFPDYELVVATFFESYSVKELDKGCLLQFEKRPNGWHVIVIAYSPNPEVKKDELIWSLKRNKFLKINFPHTKMDKENHEEESKYLNNWNKKYYRICPYFGYSGWDIDVISTYGKVKNLPDSVLYSLGRAYSSYAASLLHLIGGFQANKAYFNLDEGQSMNNKQLNTYLYYENKAIETYQKVRTLNPDFETIVGNIKTKVANEYVSLFLDLTVYQKDKTAAKNLPDNLYDSFYTSLAENCLTSCEKNAILFTYGDNDTYALLYVQSKLGFRTDVLVVNVNLLQSARYISSLRYPSLEKNSLPVSFAPDQIRDKVRDYVIVKKDLIGPNDLFDLIKFVKNDSNTLNYGPETNYFYFPTDSLTFFSGSSLPNLTWKINSYYLTKSQLLTLDILATNKWARPVYFTASSDAESCVGLINYFQDEGLAYRITSHKRNTSDTLRGWGTVNADITFDNLMHHFNWAGLDKMSSHERVACLDYQFIFNRLAETLIAEKKLDSARVVLDKGMELLSNKTLKFDMNTLSTIESYYKLKDFKKGNEISDTLMNNILSDNLGYKDITQVLGIPSKVQTIQALKNLLKKYNQLEILRKIENY